MDVDKEIGGVVNESNAEYNPNKDFTSLNCWQKAKEVKLFFYMAHSVFDEIK